MRSFLLATICGLVLLGPAGCSVPNLESPECTESRDLVRRFYAVHLGIESGTEQEAQERRDKFLSKRLADELAAREPSTMDIFTGTTERPKGFRVGECSSEGENKARLQIVLLWRNEDVNEQREVQVATVRSESGWLIDGVSN